MSLIRKIVPKSLLMVVLLLILILITGLTGQHLLSDFFFDKSDLGNYVNSQPSDFSKVDESYRIPDSANSMESRLPLVLNAKSISDQITKERIENARKVYEKGSRRQKIQALHLIAYVSPADAFVILQELLVTEDKTPELLGHIRHLMVLLAEERTYLSDADIKSIYYLQDSVAQKLAVIILSERNDYSLLKEYVKSRESKLTSDDPVERKFALREIGSVGFAAANPHFVKALGDSDSTIKLQALDHLAVHGTTNDVSTIEPLLRDSDPQVANRAQQAIKSLWNKSTPEELPLSRRLIQPGFPASGLVPD